MLIFAALLTPKPQLFMRLLYAFLLTVISTMTYAQNAIAVYQKDGQVAKFAFTEKPVLTYSGNDLVLTTTKTTVQYPIYMLQKVAVDLSDDFINDIKEVKLEAQFRFEGETLIISGGEPGSPVYLYNTKGIMVGQHRLDGDGHAAIPLQGMDKSLYIVKTTRFTFKFRKS